MPDGLLQRDIWEVLHAKHLTKDMQVLQKNTYEDKVVDPIHKQALTNQIQ